MSREIIDYPLKDKTTIVTSAFLLEKMGIHVKRNHDNQTDFITRAIVNQMEREGDFAIREEMGEISNG